MDSKKYSFDDFREIIARLRAKDGCPWDRVQTHESLRDCIIEEAYEVVEGIDIYQASGDDSSLCEELGDVLLQVVMHACISEQEGRFTIEDVIQGISEKMIRRHPHVFGAKTGEVSGAVMQSWEEIKRQEKHEERVSQGMRRVAKTLPANIRAVKVQNKAARAGWESQDYNQAANAVENALKKLSYSVEEGKKDTFFEEFGDMIFSVVNLSRFLDVNAENALTNATEKFINRFEYIVEKGQVKGQKLKNMDSGSIDE